MSDGKQQIWLKRHAGTLAILELVIIIGLAISTVLLAVSKEHSTNQVQVSTQQSQQASSATTQAVSTTAYKLSACKSGATQTVGNAGYVVGTDIAPGNYAVQDALPASNDTASWSNVDIYAKQADFKGHNGGGEMNSLQPDAGQTAHTMLKDGEYVSVWADDAVFTCQ